MVRGFFFFQVQSSVFGLLILDALVKKDGAILGLGDPYGGQCIYLHGLLLESCTRTYD